MFTYSIHLVEWMTIMIMAYTHWACGSWSYLYSLSKSSQPPYEVGIIILILQMGRQR